MRTLDLCCPADISVEVPVPLPSPHCSTHTQAGFKAPSRTQLVSLLWCRCAPHTLQKFSNSFKQECRTEHGSLTDAPAITTKRPSFKPRAKRFVCRLRWSAAARRWFVGSFTELLSSVLQSFIESECDAVRALERENDREWSIVPRQGVDLRHHEPQGEEGGVRGSGTHRAEGRGAGEGALWGLCNLNFILCLFNLNVTIKLFLGWDCLRIYFYFMKNTFLHLCETIWFNYTAFEIITFRFIFAPMKRVIYIFPKCMCFLFHSVLWILADYE